MKRTLSIILAAVMVIGVMAVIPFTVSADATPEGTPIGSLAELAAIADPAGKYYLTADITGFDTTIEEPFTGTLDGNGHKITISKPIFKSLKGTVKNLTIEGEVSGTAKNFGALAITADGDDVLVDNCVNKAKVSSTKENVGGFIGGSNATNLIFTNCVNDADLPAITKNAGGLLGNALKYGVTFVNCVNNGNITGTGGAVGGMLGYKTDSKNSNSNRDAVVIVNSINNGNITGTNQIGGFVGYVYGATLSAGVIVNCVNNGTINATADAGFASQFIGYSNIVCNTILNSIGAGAATAKYNCIIGCSSADAKYFNVSNVVYVEEGKPEYWSYAVSDSNKKNQIKFADQNDGVTVVEKAKIENGDAAKLVNDAAGKVIFNQAAADKTPTPALGMTSGKFSVKNGSAAAVEYATLAEAVAAVEEGGVITLNGDIYSPNGLVFTKDGVNFTIDFNNKSVNIFKSEAIVPLVTNGKVTIKNLKLEATSLVGILLKSQKDAESKYMSGTVEVIDSEINSWHRGIELWAGKSLTVNNCKINSQYPINANENPGQNTIIVKKSELKGTAGYGIYVRNSSTLTVEDSKIEVIGSNSGIQMITSYHKDESVTSTLKNVELKTAVSYGITTNPFNKVYIDGGRYESAGNATVNISGIYAYGEIKGGTFINTNSGRNNGVLRVYANGSETEKIGSITATATAHTFDTTNYADAPVLDIKGGNFIYQPESPSAMGTVLTAGIYNTNNLQTGFANVSGGYFSKIVTPNAADAEEKDKNFGLPIAIKMSAPSDIKILAKTIFERTAETKEVLIYDAGYVDNTDSTKPVYVPAVDFAGKLAFPTGANVAEVAPDGAALKVTAHVHTKVVDVAAVAATCTTDGKTEGAHCSVCNAIISASSVVPATGHTEVVDAAVEATCTEKGKTEGKHCSVCNEVIVAQTEVAAKGHTAGEWEVKTAAAVGVKGEEVKKCTVCQEVLESREIPALPEETSGHTDDVIDDTTAPDSGDDNVTEPAPAEASCQGCDGTAAFAVVIAIVCGTFGLALVKRKF